MSFLQLVFYLDKTKPGINSILPDSVILTHIATPHSLTSTLRKKIHFALGDETYSLQLPKVQSRSMAKLTNMFAEDLPNSEEKPPTMPYEQSPMVNTYNMHFTVSGAAHEYDLSLPIGDSKIIITTMQQEKTR